MRAPDQFSYDETERPFLARWGFALGICALAAGAVFLLTQVFSGKSSPLSRKPPEIVAIKPVATPPPPSTPPPTPAAPKETPMNTLTADDLKEPDSSPQAPDPGIGTNVVGNGPADGFGLGRNSGSSGSPQSGSKGGGGSRYGWYGTKVTDAIREALRANPATRDTSFSVKVVVWLDSRGRVRRVDLPQSTGNPAVDDALRHSALVGLQIPESPPENRSVRYELRLTASRPN